MEKREIVGLEICGKNWSSNLHSRRNKGTKTHVNSKINQKSTATEEQHQYLCMIGITGFIALIIQKYLCCGYSYAE